MDPANSNNNIKKQTNDHLCDVCLLVSFSIYMQMQMDDNSVDDDGDNDRLLFSAIFFIFPEKNQFENTFRHIHIRITWLW